MTRDECLKAISAAFDGVYVWMIPGFWNIHISTEPKREIMLSDTFTRNNIDQEGISPDKLTNMIKSLDVGDWIETDDGVLIRIMYDTSENKPVQFGVVSYPNS